MNKARVIDSSNQFFGLTGEIYRRTDSLVQVKLGAYVKTFRPDQIVEILEISFK